MKCEICGRKEAEQVISVEGAILNVCNQCSKFGKRQIISNISKTKAYIKSRKEETIVEEYGKKIREARQKLGLKLEDLAKKINEKLSYLEHIEKEKTLPNIKTAKKLEKALNIKLIELENNILIPTTKHKKEKLSLMDIAIIEED